MPNIGLEYIFPTASLKNVIKFVLSLTEKISPKTTPSALNNDLKLLFTLSVVSVTNLGFCFIAHTQGYWLIFHVLPVQCHQLQWLKDTHIKKLVLWALEVLRGTIWDRGTVG